MNEIIVHCTATPPQWMYNNSIEAKIIEVTRWHRARGFRTIGYHWIIDRDGTVAAGRPETEMGAHVKGHNMGTIGISLIGAAGAAATDEFNEHFTFAQRAALADLIREISARTNIKRVTGHNLYAAKGCPGFDVKKEFPWPPKKVQSKGLFALLMEFIRGFIKS